MIAMIRKIGRARAARFQCVIYSGAPKISRGLSLYRIFGAQKIAQDDGVVVQAILGGKKQGD
jgi:hypothetical protein